jgi:hypothetical protein
MNDMILNYKIVVENPLRAYETFLDIDEFLEWSDIVCFYDFISIEYTDFKGDVVQLKDLSVIKNLLNTDSDYYKKTKTKYLLKEYECYLEITNNDLYNFLKIMRKVVDINNFFDINKLTKTDINNLIEMSKYYFFYNQTNLKHIFKNLFEEIVSVFVISIFDPKIDVNNIKKYELEVVDCQPSEGINFIFNEYLRICNRGEFVFDINQYTTSSMFYYDYDYTTPFQIFDLFISKEELAKYNDIEDNIIINIKKLKDDFNNYIHININDILVAKKRNAYLNLKINKKNKSNN